MSFARSNDLALLHPFVRERVRTLAQKLEAEGLPFRAFEAFRSPQRQNSLYAQGRTAPGNRVTNAKPWQSYHQYGLAVDFVLFENGAWSWNDSGQRRAWWERYHEIARSLGLEPLSWEKPHVQLKGTSLADLRAGRYPAGGDSSWADNLEAAIRSWAAGAPPRPEAAPSRPPVPVEEVEDGLDWKDAPRPGKEGWHRKFEGREWRYDPDGVYLRDGGPLRTPGNPVTVTRILERYGGPILTAAVKHGVPPQLLVMTIATETGNLRNFGFTGPMSFRWEPHVRVRDVSPQTVGDYSAGPMQVLATTARGIIRNRDLPYDPFVAAPAFATRPAPPADLPIYAGPLALDVGAAVIAEGMAETGSDPILVAARYNAGSLRSSSANPWKLRSYGDHLDRAAKWYGDACAVLKPMIG